MVMTSDVSVAFLKNLPIGDVCDLIPDRSCNVVLWYVGCFGLKQASIEFYRKHIINPLISNGLDVAFWLVDLTAWFAFKNTKGDITKTSRFCKIINSFKAPDIHCLASSYIFSRLKQINNAEVIEYFEKLACYDFLKCASRQYEKKSIFVKDVFDANCEIMKKFYDYDVSQAYAFFQYMEGILLIEEIVVREIANGRRIIDIYFILPNDEFKYYLDKNQSFQKDLSFYLSQTLDLLSIEVNVNFIHFQYGNKMCDRPYNAPGKVVGSNAFNRDAIVGKVTFNSFVGER